MSDAEQTDDAELPLSRSSEEASASKAVEDKAQASEPEKGEGGNEELEEGDGDEAAVDWWGGATSWMSSTVSSVSQVRLLSFKSYYALPMSLHGICHELYFVIPFLNPRQLTANSETLEHHSLSWYTGLEKVILP